MRASQSPDHYISAGIPAGFLIRGLYGVSGAVAVAYQVLWARMLALQFGVSIFGVVAATAAFMFGLGAGSFWAARRGQHWSRPLRIFAVVEIGVALFAWVFPALLEGLDRGVAALNVDAVAMWYLAYGTGTVLLVAVPAVALGAAFPAVLKAAAQLRVPVSSIYGWNAVGGAVGALLPLLLIPSWGLLVSTYVLMGCGMVVAGVALGLSRAVPERGPGRLSVPAAELVQAAEKLRPVDWLGYALVGAAALMLEIAWIRLFGMLMLRTEYVMALILAVYLSGIGLGSLLVRPGHCRYWLEFGPGVAALAAVAGLWGLPYLAQWLAAGQFATLNTALVWQGLALAGLTLPVTLMLGAWFPALSRHLGQKGHHSGRLYAVNAIGGGVGAIVAAVVILPLVGSTGTVVIAALTLMLVATAWVTDKRFALAVVPVAALAAPVWDLPPVRELLPGTLADSRDLARYEDALAVTHVVERDSGHRVLLTDLQRMDASTEPSALHSQRNQLRLPLILHPDAREILLIGLGTGISAQVAATLPGAHVTAVELSQGAIRAAAGFFDGANAGVMGVIDVRRDDGRRFLKLSPQRYDLIVGDLFHPDLVGRSALLSVQQFEAGYRHLRDQGLYVQWLALNQFDWSSLLVVIRSFAQVFPRHALFVDGFRLALVGARSGFRSAAQLQEQLAALPVAVRRGLFGREGLWTWLGRYWAVDAGPGPVQDQWLPRIEYALPRLRFAGNTVLTDVVEKMLARRPDVQQVAGVFAVAPVDVERLRAAYQATTLALRGWVARFEGRASQAALLLQQAYRRNPDDRWLAAALADELFASLVQARRRGIPEQQVLAAVLSVDPDHIPALRALARWEAAQGRHEIAERYRRRLRDLDPYGRAQH